MKEIIFDGNYWIHPDLPGEHTYASSVKYIPAKRGIDKSKYFKNRRKNER